MAKAPKPRGRPTTFTQAKADAICERLSTGECLEDICRSPGFPSVSSVHRWREADQAFSGNFGRARDIGYDAIARRTRNTARGKTEAQGGDSTGDVQRDKLIIETDLKLLAKWDPRRYGDKLAIGGDDAAPPVRIERIERVIVRPQD